MPGVARRESLRSDYVIGGEIMREMKRVLLGACLFTAIALNLAACGGAKSRITTSWRDPTNTSLRFHKIVAIAIHPDEKVRRSMEDAMVRHIASSVPSYTLVPYEALVDREKVRQILQATEYDGALVMRIINVEGESTTPAAGEAQPQSNMFAYVGWAASIVNDSNYLKANKDVFVEIDLYSISDAKRVYFSRSETMHPHTLDALIESIVRANVDLIRGDNLI